MSELNAAIGLMQLERVDDSILSRKTAANYYRDRLKNIEGIRLHAEPTGVEQNYSYFPIFITSQFPVSRDELYFKLRERGIFSRRYFYPLITSFQMYSGLPSVLENSFPVAMSAADEVLCLPLYEDMDAEDQDRVLNVILIANSNA
jgi:dTDP-4-amino-4,6-dideoxygalactose transaminase